MKIRTAFLAAVSAAGLLGAASASAASLRIWNGSAWVANGDVTLTGPTTASYLGLPAPCTASFILRITSGVAKVRSAKFSGSTTCTGIRTNIVATSPSTWWKVSAPVAYTGANPPFSGSPTLSGRIYSLTISGIRVTIPAPLNANCPSTTTTGSITGRLDKGNQTTPPSSAKPYNRFVFKGTLGPCAVQTRPKTDSTAGPYYALTPARPIRVVP